MQMNGRKARDIPAIALGNMTGHRLKVKKPGDQQEAGIRYPERMCAFTDTVKQDDTSSAKLLIAPCSSPR